jgi:uncharacterized integral membrane protein (TIGR00697 family)
LGAVLIAARLGRVWLIALLGAMLVLMNIFVLKQMDLFGMALTGGNVLYAAVFLSTDLLAEHWGKRAAYRAVRVGFAISLFFLVMSNLILLYTPNAFDAELGGHAAMTTLFSPQWRIVAASMISYLVVQHLDVWLFEWWRRRTGGRMLWLRNNGSTWVSQAVDTVLFTSLAFVGAGFPIWNMIAFTYIVKIIVAAIDTPFIYLSKTPLFRPRDTA